MSENNASKAILYHVHDPMCSWCWGFRRSWDLLRTTLPTAVTVVDVVGGLAPDCDKPMPLEQQKTIAGYWQKVAEQTSGKAVKAFFEMMADEEVKHVKILADQYKAYQQNQKFNPGDYTEDHSGDITSKVITAELRAEISAVDYEAAAISAAMSMEENAIKLYAI